MAFTFSTETFARRSALIHAETVLAAYLQGQEKLYAVRDAVHELRALFHEGAVQPAALIARAVTLDPDDTEGRHALVTAALDLIGQQVGADRMTGKER